MSSSILTSIDLTGSDDIEIIRFLHCAGRGPSPIILFFGRFAQDEVFQNENEANTYDEAVSHEDLE